VSFIVAVFSIAVNARLSGRGDDASFEHLQNMKNDPMKLLIIK
jgi:hypothetical protein